MDVERSSLLNCFVNFLLEENYLLTAFELLHELLDDGRDDQALRLKEVFSNPSQFPPDQISRFNSLREVADPQSLLEEKDALEEKLALGEYELRLAREDILKLKTELQKKTESFNDKLTVSNAVTSEIHRSELHRQKQDTVFSDLGPLKENERQDLNCAIKEYLLIAGYRLTAMTFYEEVTDENLDVWQDTPAHVPDALRHYYYQYLSSTTEAAEVFPGPYDGGSNPSKPMETQTFYSPIINHEKIAMLREIESVKQENGRLNQANVCLMKKKDLADGQVTALTKSIEGLQKDLKDKDKLVQDLKQSLKLQIKELNDCRAEITSLKMHIEGSCSGRNLATNDVDNAQSETLERYKEEIKSLYMEIENFKSMNMNAPVSMVSFIPEKEYVNLDEKVVEIHEDKNVISHPVNAAMGTGDAGGTQLLGTQSFDDNSDRTKEPSSVLLLIPNDNGSLENTQNFSIYSGGLPSEDTEQLKSEYVCVEAVPEKKVLGTIQILADALPKIVPYVLINHREELLPLIMCAIERHPDSSTRDSLTHTLFNLIKRPDEQQRRIIMDACVNLAKNVGEMRTETELLPQCWEQINHMYEERRLLVAQSCGELAKFVQPEIRDSLILSIVQQLVEDAATVVREAAVYNLAMLLPLFPNMDKYFKVEELMFQLVCDPSGAVVDSALKHLVPTVIKWGNKLEHILRVLLSHILSCVQHSLPLSGIEGSVESYLHLLGERERWNVDVLLRMLTEMLPSVHGKAIETCPFLSAPETTGTGFSTSLLELYAKGHASWLAFEWMHVNCFPDLIHFACLLPPKEDKLRNRITKFLLAVSEYFGESYLTHIMLPVFLVAVGDTSDLTYIPSSIQPRIKGLRPRTAVAERLATMCVLPLLLVGVLGAPRKHEELAMYLRKLLVEGNVKVTQSTKPNDEIVDAVRFLCTFEEHHAKIFNVLWEMVVSSDVDMKIRAISVLKIVVPYIDAKVASIHILPALVTLGSEQNLNVKYASIDAFGAVAQHFKNDMTVDKICVQMDAFLDDGSHEATISVVRALAVAVPYTTDKLRDYLLSKIFQYTASPNSESDMMHRRETANAFCEAIRALDATDLPANSIREFFIPAIQNLLKDSDALDPAHKEALEIIMKERAGGTYDSSSIGKVMGGHLGLASSVTILFGEGGLLGKKDIPDPPVPTPAPDMGDSPKSVPPPPAEDTRFRRIMRGHFTEMLRGKVKTQEESQS